MVVVLAEHRRGGGVAGAGNLACDPDVVGLDLLARLVGARIARVDVDQGFGDAFQVAEGRSRQAATLSIVV